MMQNDKPKEYRPFKEKYSLDQRKKELEKQKEKYPNMIPVIVEKHKSSKLAPLEKSKFLVSQEVKLIEFQQTVRKKLTLGPTEAIFFFIGKSKLERQDALLKEIYAKSKDPQDGFLYITYAEQENMGGF